MVEANEAVTEAGATFTMVIAPALSTGVLIPPDRPILVTVPKPMLTVSISEATESISAVRVRVATLPLVPKETVALPELRFEQVMPTPLHAKV